MKYLQKNKRKFAAQNFTTAISIINNVIYLGVNDLYTDKNYLLVDKTQVEFPDVASLIYEMGSKTYVASLKSAFNNNIESFYLINEKNIVKQESGKIYFEK